MLTGVTWKGAMPEKPHIYVTVNHNESGQPWEVFIRYDKIESFEWITDKATSITRMLQFGMTLEEISAEMKETQSPATKHFIPGGGGECPSIVARIGLLLEKHANWLKDQASVGSNG